MEGTLLTSHINETVMYVVAVLRSFLGPLSFCFGFILILPASGLASEPELQPKTGEMVVKVFKTHSKYLKGRLQNFDSFPLITPLKNVHTFWTKNTPKIENTEFWTKNFFLDQPN